MKRFFIRILDNIRARKYFILYISISLLLLLALAGQVIHKYSAHDKNLQTAADNKQTVVFDITTGKEVDVSKILHNGPKTEEVATPKSPTETPPIKQADVMFIIDNLGLNGTDTEKAIALPKEFILAFSPYNDTSLELSKEAYDKGHMTLADLPTQLKDSVETPGNLALTIDNNDFKNSRNLDAVVSKVYQPAGVLTEPNDLFTKSQNFLPILHEISQRKLFLAYGGDGDDIDARAHDNDVELLKIDMVINDNEDVEKQLANVETMVAKSGLIVVMIKAPSSETVDVISKWLGTLREKNIHLISSSK